MNRSQTLKDRLKDLERRGALVRPAKPRREFKMVARKPGALARFLAERGKWAASPTGCYEAALSPDWNG